MRPQSGILIFQSMDGSLTEFIVSAKWKIVYNVKNRRKRSTCLLEDIDEAFELVKTE